MLSAPEIVALQKQLTEFRFEQWRHEVLFTPQWWFLIFLLVAPWPIWLKLVDRKRVLEICLFGALVLILVTMLDAIGVNLGFWGYKYKIIPLFPSLLPIDFSALVVGHMLIYQYFRPWKTFLIALTLVGGILAFAGEPLLEYIGIYQRYGWEYWYSFPIYIGKTVVCRLMVSKLMKFGQGGNERERRY